MEPHARKPAHAPDHEWIPDGWSPEDLPAHRTGVTSLDDYRYINSVPHKNKCRVDVIRPVLEGLFPGLFDFGNRAHQQCVLDLTEKGVMHKPSEGNSYPFPHEGTANELWRPDYHGRIAAHFRRYLFDSEEVRKYKEICRHWQIDPYWPENPYTQRQQSPRPLP